MTTWPPLILLGFRFLQYLLPTITGLPVKPAAPKFGPHDDGGLLLVWWAGLAWGRPLLLTYEPDKSHLLLPAVINGSLAEMKSWLGRPCSQPSLAAPVTLVSC